MKLCLNPNWDNFTGANWPPFAVPSMRLWDTGDTWADIEKTAGNYNFSTLDAHLAALTAHGISDFVYTAGKIPTFYNVGSVTQFGAFVSALAAHITQVWKGTWAFEQWNEPNLGQFYSGTAAQLLAFSRAAYAILKPLGIKVLSPSGSGGTAVGNFILSYLTACAGNFPFDVFAYHAYLQDGQRTAANMAKILSDIKFKKSGFGITGPTWFTEGSWGKEADYTPPLTDAERIAYINLQVSSMTAAGVERYYWYAFNNSAGFGILATGTPPVLTPAGLAFQSLVKGTPMPTTSTVNIPVPATKVTAPAVAVPVPPTSVMAPSQAVPVPASTIQAPAQTVPVPAGQIALTIVDSTANGVTATLSGTTLTLTDKGAPPPPPPPPTGTTGWLGADALTGTVAIGQKVTVNASAGPVRSSGSGTAAPISPQPNPLIGQIVTVLAGPSGIYWQVQFGGSPPNPPPPPPPPPSGVLAAFPGAQGGGAQATGGRGGAVFEVTNLNDSGVGSLRAALQATGARTIVFRVGGVINVAGDLRIGNPFVTLAGHTAPGGGIKLAGTGAVMWVNTHDVVIRYLCYDGNSPLNGPSDGSVSFDAGSGTVYNVVFDHCSGFHVTNKQLIVLANDGGRVRNVTFQWCMTYKPDKGHPVGPMVDATTWPAKDVTDIDFHHNAFFDTSHRLPLFNGKSGRWVNNLVYNWDWFAGLWQGGCTPDIIGNKYVAGNMNSGDNSGHPHPFEFTAAQSTDDTSRSMPGPPSIYMRGNIGPQLSDPTGNQALLCGQVNSEGGAETGPVTASWFRSSPLAALPIPITEDDVRNLDAILIPLVGNSQQLNADGSLTARRQKEDAAMIAEYQAKTPGSLWTAPAGYVTAPVANGTPYSSSFHDGLSDQWKQAMGLDTSKPQNNVLMPDGYTALEWFLAGRTK